MGLVENVLKRFGLVTERELSDAVKAEVGKRARRWFEPEADAEKWTMPDPSLYDNQANLYRTLSYIGTVVDIVADACIDSDFDIVDLDGIESEDHEFVQLMENPNPFDSRTEFLRAHFAWRKTAGNSFWFLNRASENVPPDEMWILPPSNITPVPDGKMGLRGYLYMPGNGMEIPLEPWEVIHFKSFNPFSRYYGLSALESLASIAYGANAAQEWNTRLFAENNARLPGILAFAEQISDADWENMKKSVQDSAKKRNNMLLRGVGAGGVNWIQGTATQKDMEFLAGLEMSKRDIYDRLTPGLYSAMANSALTNGENGMVLFAKYSVMPLLRETAEKLNSDLLPAYGEWRARYEDVVPEDKTTKMAEITLFSQFHTIDEVRVDKYGDEPDPDPARGALFVSQVTPTIAQPAEPVATIPPSEPDRVDEAVKADLLRWKRKAIKNVGTAKAAEFESDHIPYDVSARLKTGISACKTNGDIALLFDAELKNIKRDGDAAIKALAAALDRVAALHE